MSRLRYLPPRLLRGEDRLEGFASRSAEQTTWLREYARQADAVGSAKVLVVVAEGGREAVAYYAWSMASVGIDEAPRRLRKGGGRYRQPVALLSRLAVSTAHERRGLGAGLLLDVIRRTAELGSEIGCRGLIVHAEDEAARDFYLRVLPDFEPSPTDDMHLFLLMKDIRRTLST